MQQGTLLLWAAIAAFAVVMIVLGTAFERRFDDSPPPAKVRRAYLVSEWAAGLVITAFVIYALTGDRLTLPLTLALSPFLALRVWLYSGRRLSPLSTRYLPKCLHCGQTTIRGESRCQWCHRRVE